MGSSGTSLWLGLKWCSQDTSQHTSSHTISLQVKIHPFDRIQFRGPQSTSRSSGSCWSQNVSNIAFFTGLFVIVSWISFLIPMDVIPGRMALLVTLFLVLVNIFNNVTTNTPKAEGLTAIEAWMLACILFVFGALVE